MAVDAFTGFTFARVLKSKSASESSRALLEYVCTHGQPEGICTDNGGEFQGDFVAYCEHEGIPLYKTAAYAPWQNSFAEQKNRVLQSIARKMDVDGPAIRGIGPEDLLKAVVLAANGYIGPRGYSPFFLMCGREPYWPQMPDQLPLAQASAQNHPVNSHVERWSAALRKARQAVLEAQSDKQLRLALTSNLGPEYRAEVEIAGLRPGDPVEFRNDVANAPKQERCWKAGEVIRKDGTAVTVERDGRYYKVYKAT